MSEFEIHLKRHLSFIAKSCEEYDRGKPDEALRISVSLRVLFHDTKRSKSVLSYLNVKGKIKLASTFGYEEKLNLLGAKNVNWHTALPIMMTSDGSQAPLDSWDIVSEKMVEDWWNEEIWREGGEKYTRRDIVLSAANQDGGAHVDANPNFKTIKFRQGPSVKIKINGVPVPDAMRNHHYRILRQIAYEVLNSKELMDLSKNI